MNFYVNHALVVDKLHRVCGFEQGIWLGVYIEKKTVMRKKAVNYCEVNFYKLMSKACFCKTMRNLRKRSKTICVQSPASRNLRSAGNLQVFSNYQARFGFSVFQKLLGGLDQATSCRRFYSQFVQIITLQTSLRRNGTSILVRSAESCLQRHRFSLLSNTNSGPLQRHGLF